VRAIVTTSWDDGTELDLKLADLLAERGLRGTFYCAPRNRERPVMGAAALRRIAQRFEVGAHSLTHRDLRSLGEEELRSEVAGSRRELQDMLGRPVEMFCYPKGRYGWREVQAVWECGFLGARTTQAFRFDLPADPFHMAVTIAARRYPAHFWALHCARSRSAGGFGVLLRHGLWRPWRELADALFDHALKCGGVWHLWGHSHEVERYGMWGELLSVLDRVSGRDDVDYLTNAEVVRRAQAPGR
jgi:peptidoglycan/xylan/chitin deacetylase (PgdA/CDA1 family)